MESPRRFGEALPGLLAGLFPLLFIPTLTDAYVLPRAALCLAGASLLVGWALATSSLRLGGLGPPALAVALGALLAAALSVSPTLSLVGAYGRYESMATRLAYLGLFVGSAWVSRSRESRDWTLTAFVAGCVAASGEAIFESVTGFPPRPDGNLGQANLLGALVAMAVAVVVTRCLSRPAWALALLPLLAGLAVSSSRSGGLGAVAGSLVVFPLLARERRRRVLLLVMAGAAAAFAVALLLVSPLAALNGDTGAARLHVWRDSLPLIAARPLTGYGEDTLGLVFGSRLSGDWEPGVSFDRVHQNELDLLVAQGALGLAASTWLFAAWLRGAWRRVWAEEAAEPELVAVLAAWVAYAVFVQVNFDWVAAAAPLWLLAGVGWAAVREPGPRIRGRARLLLAIPPALLAIGFGLLPLLADSLSESDPGQAIRLDPLQPQYHRVLGERRLRGSDAVLRQGRDELRRAGRLGEYEAISFVELGDVEAALGEHAAALASYRRAVFLEPYNSTARERLRGAGG